MWLGDPDCGECPPDRPLRSPCHPPDGPCVPMKKPGYPAKRKPAKKDFCFNCPPKRPCNLNKCPPDSCDGTWGNADFGKRNQLKLNSESQARSDMRSIEERQTLRFLNTRTTNDDQLDDIQRNNFQGVEQQFSSSSDASKSPDKNVPTSGIALERKVLDQKYSAPPKFAKLPEYPNLLEENAEDIISTISQPKCAFLPNLTKGPEYPDLMELEAGEVCGQNFLPKLQFLSSTKTKQTLKRSVSISDYEACKTHQASASKGSSTGKSQAMRFLATLTWNGNKSHHNSPNNLSQVQRYFSSSSEGSKSPPKKKECGDKPKPPEPPSRPKPPKLKAAEPKTKVKIVYQKCPALPKLPKLPECPKVLQVPPKCPPLPKLPKLPKCPECSKLAEPKPKSAPKPAASKGSSTAKHTCSSSSGKLDEKIPKKKGLWDKIREATKREMSTYALNNPNSLEATSWKNQKRHLWTCSISCSSFSSKTNPPSYDSHPPWKSRKCKTVEEVCGEVIDEKLKALECEAAECPKDRNAPCYPEKARCAEVRKLPVKKGEKENILALKRSNNSGKIKDVHRTIGIGKSVEKIQYKKTECVETKLLKAGPCPTQINLKNCKDENPSKASSYPLPKPPAPPVHLCRCTPPPKLHPGACPCYDEAENSTHILTEPCPPKPKYNCPASQVYFCPSIKQPKKDKVCEDNKKTTK